MKENWGRFVTGTTSVVPQAQTRNVLSPLLGHIESEFTPGYLTKSMIEEPANHDSNVPPPDPSEAQLAEPIRHRALDLTARVWRPSGTAVAVALALLLGWHVVNGKHGLSSWEQKRTEDKELQREIQDLEQENARLKVRVDKLKSDPDAIEHEAREKLRYAKPGEVIVDLSGESPKGK